MRKLLFILVIMTSCQKEEVLVPIGCECNLGAKLDFSMKIIPENPNSPYWSVDYCSCGSKCNFDLEQVCGKITFIPDHGGFKRFIYNREDFYN
jgi:hypothetical protein